MHFYIMLLLRCFIYPILQNNWMILFSFAVDRAEEALAVIGLVLISLFMLELIARVITFGPIYYTTSFWYALDAGII